LITENAYCLYNTLQPREKYAQLFICDLNLMCIGENEINPLGKDNRLHTRSRV